MLGVIFWLIFDTAKLGQQQLVSFGGVIMYILLLFLFSKYPTKVSRKLIFWGIFFPSVFLMCKLLKIMSVRDVNCYSIFVLPYYDILSS